MLSLFRSPEGRRELKEEFKRWSHQAGPVGISILARNFQVVTDLSFLGRLSDVEGGPDYLAAASLAFLYLTVTSGWLWKAFGASLNTLCSQAIGSGNPALQHTWLHISILLLIVFSVPIYISWAFTEQALLLFKFDPQLCALAGNFGRWLMLWLLPSNLFVLYSNYLQTQGSVMPIAVVNIVMLGVNALLNWLLIFGGGPIDGSERGSRGLGFVGSPLATAITSWLSFLLVAGYCHWDEMPCSRRRMHGSDGDGKARPRIHEMTLATYRKEVLSWHRIKTFLSQAVPTSVGNLVEDAQLSIMSGLSGTLGATAIAVHNSTLNLFLAVTCLLYGAVKATTVRVGHYVGAGDITMAKAVSLLNLAVMTLIAAVIGTLFMTLRNELGEIFSSDSDFKSLMATIAIPLGAGYCALSLFFSAMGVLQGQGRVAVVAIAFLIGAWGITVPLAFVFVKVLDKGLLGVWLALIAGYSAITLMSGVAVWRSDWPAIVVQAQARAAVTESANNGGLKEPLLGAEPLSINGGGGGAAGGGGTASAPSFAAAVVARVQGEEESAGLLPSAVADFAEGELLAVSSNAL